DGTVVHAAADGIITTAEPVSGGYGRLVVVDHGGSVQTYYADLSKILVHPGQEVHRGDTPGLVGSSGRATAPHLHYQVRIGGVTTHIQDICRRFAAIGYLAIAPELYARQGDVSGMQDHTQIREIVARVPDAQVMSDLDAAIAWADASGVGDTSRVALTGFCWG